MMIPGLVVAHIQEVANIAQWEDEQIEYFKEKVTEEGKEEDLKKGKAPAQVLSLFFINYMIIKQTNVTYNTPFLLNFTLLLVQVALDQAAFLLDLASVDGTWDNSVERIAQCYEEAGLHEIAKFVLYRD